jgi:hypothetical protein
MLSEGRVPVLPDLSAVPSWAAICLLVLTTVTGTLLALARLVVRALPQASADRLEWWRVMLNYRLMARQLKGGEDPPSVAGQPPTEFARAAPETPPPRTGASTARIRPGGR